MRIAIVAYIDVEHGMGATRRVSMLARGLKDCGNDVWLLGALGDVQAGEDFKGILVPQYGKQLLGSKILRPIFRRILALVSFIRLIPKGIDWIFLYNLGIDALPLAVIAKVVRVRLMTDNCDIRIGGRIYQLRRWIEARSYEFADSLIRPMSSLNLVVSDFLRRGVLHDAPRATVIKVPALVDTTLFVSDNNKGEKFRQKWQLNNNSVICYLGSTQRFEGLRTLIRAVKRITETEDNIRLVIAGDLARGPTYDDLPQIIKSLDLGTTVILTGRLSTDDVIQALSAADVLVVPKLQDSANIAGFPQKLSECLSSGKPTIVTRVGDIPHYLIDGYDSIICQPNDDNALSTAIRRLLQDRKFASMLGARGRETAQREFDLNMLSLHIHQTMQSMTKSSRL